MGKQVPKPVGFTIFGRPTKLWAGAFEYWPTMPQYTYRVSMLEHDSDADLHIKTEDFSVPDVSTLESGVATVVRKLLWGQMVYVGCGWGIGRTGLFLAALQKAEMLARLRFTRESWDHKTVARVAVSEVRERYNPAAVEKPIQHAYLADLQVKTGVERLAFYQMVTRPWTLWNNEAYRLDRLVNEKSTKVRRKRRAS